MVRIMCWFMMLSPAMLQSAPLIAYSGRLGKAEGCLGDQLGRKKPDRSSWAGSRVDGDSYARLCNVSSQ